MKINTFEILNENYNDYKGKYNLNNIMAYGICAIFGKWLKDNEISEDTIEDVINNTSGLRDGNRLDIHDEYRLTDDDRYRISYIWALENGIVYAAIYDSEEDYYIGNIEIS